MVKILQSKWPVFLLSIALFLIPFFWIKPGELELGGDSTRLYLYDPSSYLKTIALYSVGQEGTVNLTPNQYLLPFLLLLSGIDAIFHSPYILIALLNSVKLVCSFVFVYLIITELLRANFKFRPLTIVLASITAGLLYVFSQSMVENMKYALLTHNQIFLNPMIFYFLLKYFSTHKFTYMLLTLVLTFLFSPNFSLIAPPPPFSFYPLVFIFLILYTFFCTKKTIPWRGLLVSVVLFTGLHAFHIIPIGLSFLDPSNDLRMRSFDKQSTNAALDYFNAISGLGQVSFKLLSPLSQGIVPIAHFIPLLITFLGFLSIRKRSLILFLSTFFYLLTLYLVSANITSLGIALYRTFFLIPGFGMFRNFIGQWQFVHAFFFSILFGISFALLLSRLKNKYAAVTTLFIILFTVMNAWPFIVGTSIRTVLYGSRNVSNIFTMDPDYEKMLTAIGAIPEDGKILEIPFTDFAYNIVAGKNTGAYVGQSMVMYLAGKSEFAGYQHTQPFSEILLRLVREKKYDEVKRLLSFFQIKYILYNNDPRVYDTYFPAFPYSHIRQSFPKNQQGLAGLVKNISASTSPVYRFGTYSLLSVDKDYYLPKFYVPQRMLLTDKATDEQFSSLLEKIHPGTEAPLIINRDDCIRTIKTCTATQYTKDIPKISYIRINPSKYLVEISPSKNPFFLVFLNRYNTGWKVYPAPRKKIDGGITGNYLRNTVTERSSQDMLVYPEMLETLTRTPLSENRHITANGYANAWYMAQSHATTHYIVEATPQRHFYIGSFITLGTLGVILILAFLTLKNRKLFA